MNDTHDTFTIERTYPATPARVFAAWSTAGAKARWFGAPGDWEEHKRSFDRDGGDRAGRRGNEAHVSPSKACTSMATRIRDRASTAPGCCSTASARRSHRQRRSADR
jgi:hypothetical protein